MELTKKVGSNSVVEGIGRCNHWIFRSKDGVLCTFPSDELVLELAARLLEDKFVKIDNRGLNNLILDILPRVPGNVLDAFVEALGEQTIAIEVAET